MTELPSGYVTFLFTDIEGSTRLFRALGDAYVTLLERHHEALRAVWLAHGGVEVKTEGDAFFVAFADAARAIEAAAEAQRVIANNVQPHDGVLRIRIGIHSGLAAPRDGDYIAYAVHQAARVVGAAHGGQILVSEETQKAAGECSVQLSSLGRFRLRDFDGPVELFRVVIPDGPPVSDMPRAIPATGHNIAPATSSFFGRGSDLDDLTSRVEAGSVVSIVGPGGAGKTRLATELGRQLTSAFTDGVWLVELAPLAPGAPVAGVVAEALGLAPGSRDPIDAVCSDFSRGAVLLILDNCEHVINSAAAFVGALLGTVPSAAVITTTREPLGVGREITWRIQPLEPESSAIELFVDRARAAGLRTDVTLQDRDLISRICARLDGNPLAIELAAARAGTIGLEAVESGLQDRFRILSSRRRDIEPRQRSMTALLDWSHDLLLPAEQVVLRRLSVFNDRFAFDGAEHACVGDGVDLGDVIDAVWALVDKSLLQVEGTASETRFAMSETVRDYAAAHLQMPEHTTVCRALAAWYLERFGPWTDFETGRLSDARLELDNIRGVIRGVADAEPDAAMYLAVTVGYVRDVTGEVVEGLSELEGYVGRLVQPSLARAMLLVATARLRHRGGSTDYGRLLDEAEALLESFGPEPQWATGRVASMRAVWLSERGDHAQAIRVAESIGTGNPSQVARARRYSALGLVKGAAGDAAGALDAHRLGLIAEEEIGAPVEIAISHNNLAEYALQAGHVSEAASHQFHTLELAAQIGSVVLVAFSLVIAARIAADDGEWGPAVLLHGAADRWLTQSGNSLHGRDAEISNRLLAEGRRILGSDYDVQWTAGHGMPLSDAIDAAHRQLSRKRR